MKTFLRAAALLFPLTLAFTPPPPLAPYARDARDASSPPAHAAVYRFVGGLWFDGRGFAHATMYSVNGTFRAEYAGRVDAEIDLTGKFVVPPFAEAHTHHFMEGMDNRELIARYLARGIFYAKNQNTMQKLTDPVRALFNNPESVDVTFALGGLTASGGHPVQIYDFLAERGHIPGWTKEQMRNQAYFVVDNERELESVWPLVRAGRPDFIKTYLEYSEEYEARKSDPKFYGKRGLSPSVLARIVERAHRDGLRVSTHVNTAADFRAAVRAGVDELSHLPLERLTEADARRAAQARVVVDTTTLSHRPVGHVPDIEEVHRHNLRLLRAAGVRLAVGTDDNNRTALEEAENLRRLGVFDALTLLKIWAEDTPRTIFPARRIGFLRDGYEASFLALDANPLADFTNVRKVSLRFKQGHLIKPEGNQTGKPDETGAPDKHP